MLDAPADLFQRRRDDVAAVGNGRSAEHDDKFGSGFKNFIQCASQRGAVMRHAALGDNRCAGGSEPLGGDFQRFFDDLGREPGQHGRHHAHFADAIGRDTQQRLLDAGKRGIAGCTGDRERNDFNRRDHFAGNDRLVGRQRREGDRLVDAIEPVDGLLVDDQNA